MLEIECLWECNDGLGESPIWCEEESSLYWSDHAGPSMEQASPRLPSMKRLNMVTGKRDTWPMSQQVGSFGFRQGGGLIAGTNTGFCTVDLETGNIEQIVDPEADLPHSRLNDGKMDRRGRYWCGSMDGRLKDSASYIYRLDPDLTCHRCAEDFPFACSNGIAFSPDDTRMYFGDTKGSAVHVFDFDIDEGRIDNRRLLLSLEDRKPGIIDGATVDAEGYYWFALNMGSKILRIDPKGRLDREIDMPIPSPTCVTFGGDNHETMYVTSQQSFVSPEQLSMHPQPGSLFAVHGLGVRGLPEPRFGA